MKKTYKELRSEIDEAMGMAARRAVGRRMKLLSKKSTTIRKKAINMMRALPIEKARKRAMKWVRNWIKQNRVNKVN